ncbi:MAG: VOC family protein [Nitrososphaerales archaeon]
MPMVYIGIRVTDLERSLKFYTELLGLKEVRRGKMSHGGIWVLLEDPESHQRLELNWYPKDSPFNTPYIVGEGLDHIGFEVKDAKALYDELSSKGVKVALEPWIEQDTTVICYVKDPDGNWIELFSRLKE